MILDNSAKTEVEPSVDARVPVGNVNVPRLKSSSDHGKGKLIRSPTESRIPNPSVLWQCMRYHDQK